jgi:hypothetical protein
MNLPRRAASEKSLAAPGVGFEEVREMSNDTPKSVGKSPMSGTYPRPVSVTPFWPATVLIGAADDFTSRCWARR